MRNRLSVTALFILTFVFSTISQSIGSVLPDTGQASCYDSTGNIIDCVGTGQDGEYDINSMSYTDNGNGTVTDKRTGLMWQKEDDGHGYNWYEAIGDTGFMGTYYNPESKDPCGKLNLASYENWRLPTIRELMTIQNYSISPLDLHPGHLNSFYWSSTMVSDMGMDAWGTSITGETTWMSTPSTYNVLCVSGDEFTQTLVDNGDNTVTDHSTALMWQKNKAGKGNWNEALSMCNDLELAGSKEWRLPNTKELLSLVDYKRSFPAINTVFSLADSSQYWSSTTNANSTYYGSSLDSYLVDFGKGYASYYGNPKSEINSVRCVRSAKLNDRKPPVIGSDSHVALVTVATGIGDSSFGGIALISGSGHSWIEMINLSTQERKTYGTFCDVDCSFSTVLNAHGSLHENLERDRSYQHVASRSLFVTQDQYNNLMKVIDEYRSKSDWAWNMVDNCTAFAKDVWKATSREKINPYFVEEHGIKRPTWPNPVSVMYSIFDLNTGVADRTINQCNSSLCSSPCPLPATFCYK